MSNANEHTIQFDAIKTKQELTKGILSEVYTSLVEKGYNPIDQLVGYLISGDPTYITNYNGARSLVRKLERYEILEEVVKSYLNIEDDK
ncbi:IreB family regulatory phosphoprotein [Clostridium bornimense]|uniref:IreB family regulatory phosphoprotein n=1 Tax=Clostridium bornimense TaxID=1216932 RepID=UPI001C109BEA|nr:IreB family regulatory phosphoprotein [Clostridium bornimense]MBU5317094.1 IreB family regulatory phosphoprotein [Clostridium bornimense]